MNWGGRGHKRHSTEACNLPTRKGHKCNLCLYNKENLMAAHILKLKYNFNTIEKVLGQF